MHWCMGFIINPKSKIMPFIFENLDSVTRAAMLSEIEHDIASGSLYTSKRFKDSGIERYPNILRTICQGGSEVNLATTLRKEGCFKDVEERVVKGKIISAKVPDNAAELFAEGEFNRFYLRALCLRAIQEGQSIQIYRARESVNPRAESEALIGKILNPETLISDLRHNTGVDTILGLPPGPNSGLSGRLVPQQ